MDFICFVSPTTSHAPYPGFKVSAANEAAAVAAALPLLNPGTAKFFVVPMEAFTEHCYTVGPQSTTAPDYV